MATINRGDKIQIDGTTWYYYGTSEGNDFYTAELTSSGSNLQIYYMDTDGSVKKLEVATAQGLVDEKDLGQNGNNTTLAYGSDGIEFKWNDLKETTSTTVNYQQTDGAYIYGTTASTPGVGDYLTKVEGVDSQKRNVHLPGRSGTEVMTYYGSKDGYDYYGDSLQNVYRIPSGGGSWEDCGYKKSYLESGGNPVIEEPPEETEETGDTVDYDILDDCDCDIAVDCNKLSTTATKIQTCATQIGLIIDDIYSLINGMPGDGAWDGEAYNSFKDNCERYKPALEELITILKAFKKLFSDAKQAGIDLGSEIDSNINNM